MIVSGWWDTGYWASEWRAGLSASGRETALKPATAFWQMECGRRFYDFRSRAQASLLTTRA